MRRMIYAAQRKLTSEHEEALQVIEHLKHLCDTKDATIKEQNNEIAALKTGSVLRAQRLELHRVNSRSVDSMIASYESKLGKAKTRGAELLAEIESLKLKIQEFKNFIAEIEGKDKAVAAKRLEVIRGLNHRIAAIEDEKRQIKRAFAAQKRLAKTLEIKVHKLEKTQENSGK